MHKKLVVITGSTKGMGNAIAQKFAKEGNDLVLIARSDRDLSEQRKFLSEKYGVNILCISADLSEKKQVQMIKEKLDEAQLSVDVLVNNLGVFQTGSILDEDDSVMERVMNLNYYAGYYLTKALLPSMLQKNTGHIFCIGSIANIYPIKEAFAYTISKYAVYGFIKTLREQLINTEVKTTAIIPGSTLTASWEGTEIPQERFILAEDIAEAIFLATSLSKGACLEEIIIRPQHGQV
jgi:short-subunit dehydrogenase